jgi:hypothetical protein
MNSQFESTYGMFARSEEKGRGILETSVYAVFTLSVVVSICQFAQAPMKISPLKPEPCVACHTDATHPRLGS